MAQFTNLFNIDLSLAVWLVHDSYDFVPGEKAISATGLLKPIRQTILASRVPSESLTEDLSERISMRLGHAIHDSIENAWEKGYARNLGLLGIPQQVIDRVQINPKPEDLKSDSLPVYLETRGTRELNGWKVSGKLDMAVNGDLKDIKTTSVFTYIKGRKDEDYVLQGSIYKWLHQDKITGDNIDIQFVFTDWQRAMTKSIVGYPETRLVSYSLPLMGLQETEDWIASRIEDLVTHFDAPQEALPRCTDEELWRSDPQWKYYADATKTDGKSTKNFDNPADANKHRAEKGKGVVIMVPGKVKACSYCKAFSICTQKDEYDHD